MKWFNSNDDGSIMQVCKMAGQEMTAITDDAGAFDLHFMHFKTGGFLSIEEAKNAAPEFARLVLNHLLSMLL
jgi:hypothetical protein